MSNQVQTIVPAVRESGPFRMQMFRGEGVGAEQKARRGFASDPGDYGRGEYWTDSEELACTYGKVRKAVIELKNVLRLDPREIVELIREEYGITKLELSLEQRLAAADRFTRDMVAQGYDGIAVYGYEQHGIWSVCVFNECPTKAAAPVIMNDKGT